MKFVNIHTHRESEQDAIELINHQVQDQWLPQSGRRYSAGFHPWEVGKHDLAEMIERVSDLASKKNVLAVGECGLDRFIDTNMELHEQVFLSQVEVAKSNDKPLIIHSVRSYPDVIKLKKQTASSIPWILHGYNGKPETTRQLLRHGFFFSFGVAVLENKEKLNESLQLIPTENLFFETDTSLEKIETIYIFAAKLLKVEVDELKAVVYNNFKRVFLEDE